MRSTKWVIVELTKFDEFLFDDGCQSTNEETDEVSFGRESEKRRAEKRFVEKVKVKTKMLPRNQRKPVKKVLFLFSTLQEISLLFLHYSLPRHVFIKATRNFVTFLCTDVKLSTHFQTILQNYTAQRSPLLFCFPFLTEKANA